MTPTVRNELVRRAVEAKKKAYAPYSKFRVGSAVLSDDGEVFTGCNVENSSYGLSICAERHAVFRLAFAGKRKIAAVAVATDERGFITPCGACRQVIGEFAGAETEIILATRSRKIKVMKFHELFPQPPALERLKKGKR
jgi:cytidine deaminase